MCEFLSSSGKQEPSDLVILLTRCFLSLPLAEACPIFYGMFGTVGLGNKTLLNTTLDLVDATVAEKNSSKKNPRLLQ